MPIRGISQPAMKVAPSAIQKPKTSVTGAMSVFVNPWCLKSGTDEDSRLFLRWTHARDTPTVEHQIERCARDSECD
ncbi:hypothetical protein GGQ85_003448 [Nitrobacter vulgaris]|nr:hypothetical protein [Nitrobacter vulgaris]